jgi:hypothetical protein
MSSKLRDIRRLAAISQAGSRLRLLTLCDGHGPDLMAASGQIRVAAHIRVVFRGVTLTNLRLA